MDKLMKQKAIISSLFGTEDNEYPLKDSRLCSFIATFTSQFLASFKKYIEVMLPITGGNVKTLDANSCLLIITIIACDICRMYQQQIQLIDGQSLGRYIIIFAEDCVYRIIGNIRKRQGHAKFISLLLCQKRARRNTQYSRLADIHENSFDDERLQKLTKYLIEGLWMHRSKNKTILPWVTGKQLFILLENESTVTQEYLKVTSNNLLDRVYVKVNEDYFFPKRSHNPIPKQISKIPGRVINCPQDHITKRCGYRLTSLIDTNERLLKSHKVFKGNIGNNRDVNNQILRNINNFNELKEVAINIVKYYKKFDIP